MKSNLIFYLLCFLGISLSAADTHKIILLAGETKLVDKTGHHDYLGGCRLLEHLLQKTPGVSTVLVTDGWPMDESIFDGADTLVFYTDGAGAQAYLQPPQHIATIQKLVEAGTGIVSLHQAVDYPAEFVSQAAQWTGGVFSKDFSGRGHWDSKHTNFPNHPVTRGVAAWEINDGWLNGFRFPEAMEGITPLLWSGKEHSGSNLGGISDVVAWAYNRPDGGRSFSMSGLDAHSAFELEGVRKFVINGILWSAKLKVPKNGADTTASLTTINSFLTPRTAPAPKAKK
jgi:hypothetical protein